MRERIPWFDGAKLDDITDYLTYVFVPALFVWRGALVPNAWVLPVVTPILLSSAYGFNRTDAKTSDHFFTGFPSYWNVVTFYLLVARWPSEVNAAILVGVCGAGVRADPLRLPVSNAGVERRDKRRRRDVGRADAAHAVAVPGCVRAGLLGLACLPVVLFPAVVLAPLRAKSFETRDSTPRGVPVKPIPIHAFNPGPYTGDGNWTWLIRGRVTTLIDAGTGESRHLEAIERALDGAALSQVIVTHGHTDHASGVTALAAKFPGVRFLKMPWPERDGRWPAPWEPLRDGSVVPAGDDTLTAIHTPGHAPDHLCLWHAESRTMFCGDLAQKGTTIYIPPNLQGDLLAYLASLERVLALRPAQLLPAHGPVIDDPDRVLRGYIEHRREREAQILELLRGGESSPDVMVIRMYRGLKDTLVPMARESVLAHLLKLEHEGRARRSGDAWHIIEP